MIHSRKRLIKLGVDLGVGLAFSFFLYIIVPEFKFIGRFATAAIVFFLAATVSTLLTGNFWRRLEHQVFQVLDTRFMVRFVDQLRFSYTIDDLIDSIQTVLEHDADASVS